MLKKQQLKTEDLAEEVVILINQEPVTYPCSLWHHKGVFSRELQFIGRSETKTRTFLLWFLIQLLSWLYTCHSVSFSEIKPFNKLTFKHIHYNPLFTIDLHIASYWECMSYVMTSQSSLYLTFWLTEQLRICRAWMSSHPQRGTSGFVKTSALWKPNVTLQGRTKMGTRAHTHKHGYSQVS